MSLGLSCGCRSCGLVPDFSLVSGQLPVLLLGCRVTVVLLFPASCDLGEVPTDFNCQIQGSHHRLEAKRTDEPHASESWLAPDARYDGWLVANVAEADWAELHVFLASVFVELAHQAPGPSVWEVPADVLCSYSANTSSAKA
eukprot:5797972-Pyramimonas_sp.AAC.1